MLDSKFSQIFLPDAVSMFASWLSLFFVIFKSLNSKHRILAGPTPLRNVLKWFKKTTDGCFVSNQVVPTTRFIPFAESIRNFDEENREGF